MFWSNQVVGDRSIQKLLLVKAKDQGEGTAGTIQKETLFEKLAESESGSIFGGRSFLSIFLALKIFLLL